MLSALSIRQFVLIEKLDLQFGPGLWALTGETGAGKSILLDSLGFALGSRADRSMVRADSEQGSVSAVFDVAKGHPVMLVMDDIGLEPDTEIVIRRVLRNDGKSRGWVNDQPVGVSALRRIGECLLEIHGQHADRGLLNPSSHRSFLDAFGKLQADLGRCHRAFERYAQAEAQLKQQKQAFEQNVEERDYLLHAQEELSQLSAAEGEENELSAQRVAMMSAEQIGGDLSAAGDLMNGPNGVENQMATIARLIARSSTKGPPVLRELADTLDKSLSDIADISRALALLQKHLNYDEDELNRIEERLFALRAAARKYKATPDTLHAALESVNEKLASIELGDAMLRQLESELAEAKQALLTAGGTLSKKRKSAALRLDKSVKVELPPLKLDKATFRTRVHSLGEETFDQWTPEGADRVEFEVSTNPGSPDGPLSQIASGGEFARFVLALKVVQADRTGVSTLIFDEVDQGIGGAVADAVGERLSIISGDAQVLVVTHSPQVAARATAHLLVEKEVSAGKKASVSVRPLDAQQRQEEIARMLSGARVTDAARKAASSLLSGAASSLKTGTRG